MKAEGWREAFGELGESCRGKKKKRNKKVMGRSPRDAGFKPHKSAAKPGEGGELLAEQVEQMPGI